MRRTALLTILVAMNAFSVMASWQFGCEEARLADAQGKSEEAERIYRSLVEKYPNESELWVAYAEHSRFYMQNYEHSEKAFLRALTSTEVRDDVAAFAYRGLGELAVKKGDNETAKKHFNASLQKRVLVDTHRSLCHLYCREKKYKDASRHAQAAVALAPNDAIAILLHAILLHRNGAIDKSVAAYQRAVELSSLESPDTQTGAKPIHCCVIYNAAGYLSVAGRKEDALKMLARFLETPNHRHLSWAEIEEDADFDNVRLTPEFKELKSRYLKN